MIKVGLIGVGYMGKTHGACYEELYKEGVRITAVADLVDSNIKEAVKKYGAKAYKDGMDLIANADVDIIDICLPTYLHSEHAIAAMKQNKGVFIEKPVCLNKEEGKALLETEKETKAKVMVGHCIRLWSEYMWLKEVVDNNTYGKVVTGVFKRISASPTWSWNNWLHQPNLSGSVALDMHIHDVDYVRYIMGEPTKVNAVASRDKKGVIQQMFSTYQYDDALIKAEVCWNYPSGFPFAMEYRVKLEKATVVYDSNAQPTLTVYLNEGGSFNPVLNKDFEGDNDKGGNVSSLGGYYSELKYFIDQYKNNEDIKIAPLSEGVKSVLLALKEIDKAGGMEK